MTAVRGVAAVLATWLALTLLFVAPAPLPERWLYVIYSPASVGLWMLTMLVAPFVVCTLAWPWIRSGSGRPADND
ncbi:hypothetical protein ABT052_12605 [Streptomyces sp. NPDC002766]|jgi:hypothetical protein|uniref:hypothetical protein n=1 Tax=unclassified Streptomyces TaxID=2593676 RepID=UPI0033183D06